MPVRTLKILALLLVVIASVVIIYLKFIHVTIKPEWDIKRVIRYGFVIENKSSEVVSDIHFKTYSPVTLTSTQKLIDVTSTHEFSKKLDDFGNLVLDFKIDFIPPYGKKKITITAELVVSKISAGAGNNHPLFLLPQNLIESKDEKIIQVAQSLKKESQNPVKGIFLWSVDHINYSGYGMRDKGAKYALETAQGDCTEYAYLNVALNRALNFPSRAVNGYIVDHDMKLNPSSFHTWSEIWFNNGWQVVDAQKNNYLENQHDYIAMNIVTHTDANKQFKRFWISNKDLKVTMK